MGVRPAGSGEGPPVILEWDAWCSPGLAAMDDDPTCMARGMLGCVDAIGGDL